MQGRGVEAKRVCGKVKGKGPVFMTTLNLASVANTAFLKFLKKNTHRKEKNAGPFFIIAVPHNQIKYLEAELLHL